MAEKTGFTGKVIKDFPTEAVLEVQLKNDEWYRVTSNDFRSFDGPRRYTVVTQPKVGESFSDVEAVVHEYNGPVYLFNTNQELEPANNRALATSPYWEDVHNISANRK